MVTTQRPDLVLQQIEARDRRKRSISPELLRQFAVACHEDGTTLCQ